MNTETTFIGKRRYIKPSCDFLPVCMESVMAIGSGNLPEKSPGLDMGGGEDDEPIETAGKARVANFYYLWDDLGIDEWLD